MGRNVMESLERSTRGQELDSLKESLGRLELFGACRFRARAESESVVQRLTGRPRPQLQLQEYSLLQPSWTYPGECISLTVTGSVAYLRRTQYDELNLPTSLSVRIILTTEHHDGEESPRRYSVHD